MSLIDIFKSPEAMPWDYEFQRARNAQLSEDVAVLSANLRSVEEDMLAISDAFDNIGWSPLPGETSQNLPLATVKDIAKIGRAMDAINPFVKRGVEARISYVWGKGVSFDGVDSIKEKLVEARRKLFNPQAYMEFERALATDGNVFTAVPMDTPANKEEFASVFRVPLDQITDAISNPNDAEDIWYYKREWMETTLSPDTGKSKEVKRTKYYVSISYYQRRKEQNKLNLPRKINNQGVEQNYVMQHTAVNKQIGWRWGLPDVAAVIFWAKAYKEYLEDNALLVKAYARLAWQIKAPTGASGAAAAAQVMRAPTRDPLTGELRDVGGTSVGGLGTELSPVAATGSTVDFSKGSALASAIASGLEVSKIVITSDPGEGNRATAETLDLPTLKAMESRQLVHTERFLELFDFWGAPVDAFAGETRVGEKDAQEAKADDSDSQRATGSGATVAVVTWPQIQSDTTKDRVAAIGTAVELGVLYKQEARKETIEVLGIAPYRPWDDLPTMEDDPAAKEKFDQEQTRIDAEAEAASVIAKQGVSGGIAAKGGGQSSNNQARDSRAANKNNNG